MPLINYENRQCGLQACKSLMKEGGVIGSEAVRHPLQKVHPATRAGLIERSPVGLIPSYCAGAVRAYHDRVVSCLGRGSARA